MKELLSRYFRSNEWKPGTGFLALLLTVGCVLSVAALVGITLDVGWGQLWRLLEHADWVFVLFVPVAVAVSHFGYTLSYLEIARSGEDCHLRLGDALRIVTTGFEPLSPRGGYAIDVRELTRRGLDAEAAERRVRLLGLLEYAVLAPITLVAAVYMMVLGMRAQTGLLPSWVIGVPLGSAIAIGLLVRYHRQGRPQGWWSPLRRQLDAIDDLLQLLRSWKRAPIALFGMFVYWAAEIAALGGCMEMFGHRRGVVAVMIVGYATGYALTRRALPLSGAGVVEALLPFALSWVGFPLAAAVLAVIAYRVFNMWLPMVPAAISLRRMDREEEVRHSSGSPAGHARFRSAVVSGGTEVRRPGTEGVHLACRGDDVVAVVSRRG